jgi:hypothetical protein
MEHLLEIITRSDWRNPYKGTVKLRSLSLGRLDVVSIKQDIRECTGSVNIITVWLISL